MRDACEQYPEQRPLLLLRFVLGEMPWRPDRLPLAGGTAWPLENASTEQLLERSPAAALAWSVFRESDPGYAVFAALKLASAPVAAERRIAQEALELLEKNPDPALLRGAVPHLGASVFLDEFPAESLLPRLRSHLEEWADAAPPGRLRERLQDYLLLHTWKGSDPAAHLRRVAEKLARGGDSMPEYTGIARWPELPRPLPPKTPASSTEDPRSRMYDRRPAGLSLPAGTALLHVPPAFPGVYHKTWDFKQGSRLVQAVSLLSPGKWSTDTARLRAALEFCRDPDVKAVAALATHDVPFITACVDAVAAVSPPDADGLAFAAAWAWRQRQPDKAVTLLEKLSSLQPPLQIRTADATIVSAVQLLLAASEPVSDTVRNACGAALDRLAVFPIKATDVESLAELADQLGMKERLLRLRETLGTAKKWPPLRVAPAKPFPSSTPPHPLAGFLTALDARPETEPPPVNFNQKAPWIQGFLTLVREQAGEHLLPRGELGNLSDLWDNESLHAKVIAGLESLAAAPGSARARWFAGLALIECGAAGKAAVVLKRLVSEALPARPLLARAACRLAFNGQLEAALEIAASLSPVTRAELFAHAIIADGGPALDQLEPALDLAERWLAALRTLQPGDVISRHYDEYGDSDTVSQALEALEAARFADEATLRSFFSNSEVLLSSASTDPLAARRRALLPALYRALALPPLADSTVLMRLSSAEKAGIPWPTKAEDAMQLLLSESDRPLSAAYNLSTWSPEMFLLQEAVRRPAWLADTALPALEKGGRVRKAAGLRQLLPLLDCPAVEFPAALEHMFAAQPSAAKYDLRIAGLLVARFRELPDASAMERLPDIPASSADPAREPPRDSWNSPTNPATASE